MNAHLSVAFTSASAEIWDLHPAWQKHSTWQKTALHHAAVRGHTATCQLLISAEADVNATDRCAFMLKICY